MYQSISLIKLWAILVSVVIMLLQGCGTTPTEQSYETDFYNQNYNNEEVNYHIIQRGETLSIIADIYGFDYKTIAALNNIYPPYIIYPGQRIEIGSGGSRSYEYDSEGIPVSIQPLPKSQELDRYKKTSLPPPSSQALKRYKRSSSRKKKSRFIRKNSDFRSQGNYYKVRKKNDFKRRGNYYRVKRGDSLYQIAKRYGKNYRQLAAWNFISPPYQLKVGQRLRLIPPQGTKPFYSSPSPVKKRSAPVKKGSVSHIVQRGDTIYNIAQRYGYTLWEIAKWNGLERPYHLSRGRRLRVAPWTKSRKSRSRTSRSRQRVTKSYGAKSGSRVYHTVVKGDTLYNISRRFGSSVSKIIQWNNLYSPYNLSVGQRLQVKPLNKWRKKGKKRGGSKIKKATRRHNTGYHTVARGETLFSISRNYGYSVSKIAGWNNLSPSYYLSVGQKLRVYPPSKVRLGRRKTTLTTRQRKSSARNKVNSHIVASGETLYSIAKRYRKTVSQLIRWNHLQSPYTLLVGQRLQFYQTKNLQRTGRRSYKKPTRYKKRSSSRYYLVKRNETLKIIAARYGISAYDLSDWNGIGAPYTLYPGQRLLIAPP